MLKQSMRIILVLTLMAQVFAKSDDLRWLVEPNARPVWEMRGVQALEPLGEAFRGTLRETGDPGIVLREQAIDAGMYGCLIIEGHFPSWYLEVFHTPAGRSDNEDDGFDLKGFDTAASVTLALVDLSTAPNWRGTINRLRLDPLQADVSSTFTIRRIGLARDVNTALKQLSPDKRGAAEVYEATPKKVKVARDQRMACWQHTLAITEELHGLSGLATYPVGQFSYIDETMLARLVPQIEIAGTVIGPKAARGVRVEDEPGKVLCRFNVAGVTITTELMPLLRGENRDSSDGLPIGGAALYRVRTTPATPLRVLVGEGGLHQRLNGKTRLGISNLEQSKDDVRMAGKGLAIVTSPAHPYHVAVRSKADMTSTPTKAGGAVVRLAAESGAIDLVLGFAANKAAAMDLTAGEPEGLVGKVEAHYAKLLESRIETPDGQLDATFRSGLYNLEYAWVAPFGWVECPRHWPALWHMQQSAAADWLGQHDRARLCIETHARAQFENGDIPHMMPWYHRRRDWGGHNQYYAWMLRKHLNLTGDVAFARDLGPVLDRALARSRQEYDLDDNGLPGWGLQIGNQEDFCATPNDGTGPSTEWRNMWLTRSELATAAGGLATATRAEAEAQRTAARMRERLWMPELGRFMGYRDALGNAHREGLYQTYLYPVIYGLLDGPEAWSSMRHVRDRLTDQSGGIYASNLFAWHVNGTWGMQMGAAQQPWATLAWAKLGQTEAAIRPLQQVAEWVMAPTARGSWPEVSTAHSADYFSPPIGPFMVAVVEGIWGLQPELAKGRITLAPCFPAEWPRARLKLPEYEANYERSGNSFRYDVKLPRELKASLRWPVGLARVRGLKVNGARIEFKQEPGVNCLWLTAELPAAREFAIEFEAQPLIVEVTAPKNLAEGEELTVGVEGARIVGLQDTLGLLRESRVGEHQVKGMLRTGLLKEGLRFGRLGQLNEAGRSLFLDCRAEELAFTLVVDLTVLPRFEAAIPLPATLTANGEVSFTLQVRNNTEQSVASRAELRLTTMSQPVDVNLSARDEVRLAIKWPRGRVGLASGDNRAELLLGDAALPLTLDASEVVRKQGGEHFVPLELPASQLIDDTRWMELRKFYGFPHFVMAPKPPLEGLEGKAKLEVEEVPGLSFNLVGRRFVPISYNQNAGAWLLDLREASYRKLYVLALPLIENHNMYGPIARLGAIVNDAGMLDNAGTGHRIISTELTCPGSLDWGWSSQGVGRFATYFGGRADRLGLLSQLRPEQADWAEGRPPAFPQAEYWSRTRNVPLSSSNLVVIELDLGQTVALRSLAVQTLGRDAALGIVAITGERNP